MRLAILLATLGLGDLAVPPTIGAEPTAAIPRGEETAVATDSASAAPDSGAVQAGKPRASISARAGRMVVHFASDVGYVITSPTRLDAKGWALTVAAVGATVTTYGYDNELRRACARSHGNDFYDAVLDVGETFVDVGFMGGTWPYWVGGAVVGTALKVDPLQSVCLDVIESHLISGGARNLAKWVIGREHPFEADRSSFFKKGTSMPSGHTSVVFEIATVFTRRSEELPAPVHIAVGVASYGIASAVALQRVDSDAHWASDVVLGAITGTVIANTVVNRNQQRRAREAIAYGPRLVPRLDSAGQPALAMVWSF